MTQTPATAYALHAAIVLTLLATACTRPKEWETDQALRRSLFQECMAALPAGPKSTHYNDWAEVIEQCGQQAYYQAQVCVANCATLPPPVVGRDDNG